MHNLSDTIKQAKELIAKSRIQESIDLMKQALQDHPSITELQGYEASFTTLERENRMGILSYEQANMRRSQVVNSLLSFYSELAKEKPETKNAKNANEQTTTESRTISNSKNAIQANHIHVGGNLIIGDSSNTRNISQGDKSIYIEKNDGPINID